MNEFSFAFIVILTLLVCPREAAVARDSSFRSIHEFQHTHPWLEISPLTRNQYEKSSQYYLSMGKDFVEQQLRKKFNKNIAKNVILYIGDGMSMSTLSATRMYMGAEEKSFSFEKFPFIGMSKTYCVDYQVADSACSSTAYFSGVKANFGTIGMSAKVRRSDCQAANDRSAFTESIAKWALDAGKSVGLVTTTRVTHASPAGLYAHTPERNWESNTDVHESNCDDRLVDDIAEQLIHGEIGSKLKVIFGGGRGEFRDEIMKDEEDLNGRRTDRKDLIDEWLRYNKTSQRRNYVWNKKDMLKLTPETTDAVLGLFAKSHTKFNYEIDGVDDMLPTLSDMTLKAVELLLSNDNGFFLFVEGGLIDYGHHDSMAHIALDETAEFSKTVELVHDFIGDEDTLHVVTADHSHTMSYSGYGDRHTNILGIGGRSDVDNIPYLKLSYANGDSYFAHRNGSSAHRLDPSKMKVLQTEFEFPVTVPRDSETHGGDDVAVYAVGPQSHLFKGSMEQNVIPHIMAYASCIGDGLTACKT